MALKNAEGKWGLEEFLIMSDNSKPGAAWHLAHVSLTNITENVDMRFLCDDWIDKKQDHKVGGTQCASGMFQTDVNQNVTNKEPVPRNPAQPQVLRFESSGPNVVYIRPCWHWYASGIPQGGERDVRPGGATSHREAGIEQLVVSWQVWRRNEAYGSPKEQLKLVEGTGGIYQYKLSVSAHRY